MGFRVLLDERPIIGNAETWTVWDREAAVLADIVDRVGVAAGVDGRAEIGARWPHHRQFVEIGVPDGRHAVAMRRAGRVQFDIEAERFGKARDLHGARDADVEIRVCADEIGAVGEDERRVRFQPAHMLAEQQRRLDHLAQAAMRVRREAAIAVGILVPEKAGVIAGAADLEGVGEGPEMAGRVVHEGHAVADALAEQAHGLRVALRAAIRPAMHLEATVAHGVALLREIGERLGRGQPAAVSTEPCRGIGGNTGLGAAQHLAD